MSAEANRMQHVEADRLRRTMRRLPFLMALIFGMLWAFLYLILGRFHAMWSMYDKEFPFLLPSLLGIHKEAMSAFVGTLFAFIDGSLAAFTVSGLLVLVLQRVWQGGNAWRSRGLTIPMTTGLLVLLAIFARGCPP